MTPADFEEIFERNVPAGDSETLQALKNVLYESITLLTPFAEFVDFPAAATSPGEKGQFAFGERTGITWLAVYIGDGVSHQWGFTPLQKYYPS